MPRARCRSRRRSRPGGCLPAPKTLCDGPNGTQVGRTGTFPAESGPALPTAPTHRRRPPRGTGGRRTAMSSPRRWNLPPGTAGSASGTRAPTKPTRRKDSASAHGPARHRDSAGAYEPTRRRDASGTYEGGSARESVRAPSTARAQLPYHRDTNPVTAGNAAHVTDEVPAGQRVLQPDVTARSLHEGLCPENAQEGDAFGVLRAGLGRVDHDPQVSARDTEHIAVQCHGTDLGMVDDLA